VDGSCFTARGQSTLPRDPAYFLRTICAVHESGSGTKLPIWDVRPTDASGGKADEMCSGGVLLSLTQPGHRVTVLFCERDSQICAKDRNLSADNPPLRLIAYLHAEMRLDPWTNLGRAWTVGAHCEGLLGV
jgi:hypothetical protein